MDHRMTQKEIDEALVLAMEADKREIERLRAELAASQAREKLLTDALEKVLSWIDAWCDTSPETGFEPVERAADAALNLPADDTALRAALDQRERETIERVVALCDSEYWSYAGDLIRVIRALKVKP